MLSDMTNKISSISNLRGIGIFFVILGHANPERPLSWYIYSFHMPLFFIVSGYLLHGRESRGIKNHTVKAVKRYMIPYTIFFLLSFVSASVLFPLVFNKPLISSPFTFPDILKAYFYASAWLERIPLGNISLWYLPFAMITSIVFFLLLKIVKNNSFILIGFAILICFIAPYYQSLFSSNRPILTINILLPALFFMISGYLFKKVEDELNFPMIITILIGVVGLVLAFLNGYANISSIKSPLYFTAALCSVYFYYAILKTDRIRLLSYAGDNSLIFLGLHLIVQTYYNALPINSFFSTRWDGFMMYIIKVAYVMVFTAILSWCYNKLKILIKRRIEIYASK
jgi:fucose 4-O-acetylase-like acetyltransferase